MITRRCASLIQLLNTDRVCSSFDPFPSNVLKYTKMDVPTLMYNLKEEVTCSVCMQLYTKPKQLPCLHIFCLQCLNNLARASAHNNMIKCPLCQREVAVPESGTLETLPDCFHMKNLLDILTIKECNTAKVTCGNCEKKSEESSFCFHCGKFWCNDCVNAHNILRENRDHRVLALKDFEDNDFEDVLKTPVFCQKELHDKEILKFYCKECDIPVCQTCVIIEHNKHDVEHVEVIARAIRANAASKLDAAKELTNTISRHIREVDERMRLIEYRSKTNKEQIQQMVKFLTLMIQEKEKILTAEVENETKVVQEQLEKSKSELQDTLEKREQSISQIETLVQHSTGAELVRTRAIVDELQQGLIEPPDIPSTAEIDVHSTVFFKNQEIAKILQEVRIGHLDRSATEANKCSVNGVKTATAGLETEIEVITRNFKGEQCYCHGDYFTLQLTSAQDPNINCIIDEVKINDRKNGSYTFSFIPIKTGQYLLAIKVNGQKIGEFLYVEIKKRSFLPLRFIGEGAFEGKTLDNPWGVAVNKSNHDIIVSDMGNDRIVVFNENGVFSKAFQHFDLKCPNGVFTDKAGRIFVCSRLSNKISLFQSNGEYIKTIMNSLYSGEFSESLEKPRGISLNDEGNLIVCDSENACLRFISPEGNILKTVRKGGLLMPFDCVCYEDKIFVSDLDAHFIKVFDSTGKFLYEFGGYGTGDGNFNRPAGLVVDKTGHLLVCSTGNHRVQVFTLDGKFVSKFGGYGNNMGQLGRPTNLSLLRSGHIVVCELDNNRLQVFE